MSEGLGARVGWGGVWGSSVVGLVMGGLGRRGVLGGGGYSRSRRKPRCPRGRVFLRSDGASAFVIGVNH